MFSRHTLCFENGSDLLACITSVPVVENILERHKLVLALCGINAVVNCDIPDIVIRKNHLNILTCLEIITSKPRKVFRNDNSDFSVFHIRNHSCKIRAVKGCSAETVIYIKLRVLETVVLCVFQQNVFLIGYAVAFALEHIVL